MFDTQPPQEGDEKLKTDLNGGNPQEPNSLVNKVRQEEVLGEKVPKIENAPLLEEHLFDNKEKIIAVSALQNTEFKLPAGESKFIRFSDGSIFIAPNGLNDGVNDEKILAYAQKKPEEIVDGGIIVKRVKVPRRDDAGNVNLKDIVAVAGLLTDPLPEQTGPHFSQLSEMEIEERHRETVGILREIFKDQEFV